jgi:hypothetical protein
MMGMSLDARQWEQADPLGRRHGLRELVACQFFPTHRFFSILDDELARVLNPAASGQV